MRTADRIGAPRAAVVRCARRTALTRWLRHEADWLLIVVPLVVAAAIGAAVALL